MDPCHLVISDTRVQGEPGIDLFYQLRHRLPALGIVFIAMPSTPA
jgi:DNA-binding NarL/FixJ family response regulator